MPLHSTFATPFRLPEAITPQEKRDTIPPRPKLTDITLFFALPGGQERIEHLDPALVNAIYWSERAVKVLASAYGPEGIYGRITLEKDQAARLFGSEASRRLLAANPALEMTPECVFLAWHGARGIGLPSAAMFTLADGSRLPARLLPCAGEDGQEEPRRAKLTGILLNLAMPDGSQRTHTLDPKQSDALFWADESIRILRKFYAPGGPAVGKRMSRQYVDYFFGSEAVRRAFEHAPAEDEAVITPEVIDLFWHSPKDEGHASAFLVKSVYSNPTNGF